MKALLLLAVFLLTAVNHYAQVTHVVQASGFDYTPSTITINVGDSVKFNVGANHPTRQVNKATYDANGITLLTGGFDFAGGNGIVGFPNEGTFYYVCTAHISQGMKGTITVQAATQVNDRVPELFELYPVPLSGNELNIALQKPAGDITISVYDISGSLRISKIREFSDRTMAIDCSTLTPGIYLLKVNAEGITQIRKFQKM